MRHCRLIAAILALAAMAFPLEKKKKVEITQTLEVLPDPPAAVTAETRRLVFHVSPLSAKGLLSQQTREALKALLKNVRGAKIVKLRAFVAGSGDQRRVGAIVSEMFSERKLALPALSVVQVGGLPLEGAQVLIESTSLDRKEVNPHGVAFISGQASSSETAPPQVKPLAEKSLGDVRIALRGAALEPSDVTRLTCLMSSLDDAGAVRELAAREFTKATAAFIQLQRGATRGVVECEAVARLRQAPGEPLRLLNPQGLNASPNYSHVALVGAPRITLTGTQMAFGFQDGDARLAFQRLEKVLDQAGASIKNVAMSSIYPISTSIADQVRRIRFEFYDKARPPASTMLPFEGLPAMDAGFAIDVVAVLPR